MAAGHTAIKAEESQDEKDIVILQIGNLLPGQEAIIRFQLLHVLRVECGAYVLRVPITFFPESMSEYHYTFSGSISAKTAITYLSAPDKCFIERDTSDFC